MCNVAGSMALLADDPWRERLPQSALSLLHDRIDAAESVIAALDVVASVPLLRLQNTPAIVGNFPLLQVIVFNEDALESRKLTGTLGSSLVDIGCRAPGLFIIT